jgi:RNA polymerase sigma factor (sigma-70 family)
MLERDDEALFDHWCRGDRHAGQMLVQRYYGYLVRFFDRRVRSSIDDLVQQTLLSVLDAGARFRRDSSFRAYLIGTARHQFINYVRRTKRDAISRSAGDPMWEHESNSRVQLNYSDESLDHAWLNDALCRVPSELRMVLRLAFWEGLTAPEISSTTGVPLNTVYSRLRRAKRRLRRDYGLTEEPSRSN